MLFLYSIVGNFLDGFIATASLIQSVTIRAALLQPLISSWNDCFSLGGLQKNLISQARS